MIKNLMIYSVLLKYLVVFNKAFIFARLTKSSHPKIVENLQVCQDENLNEDDCIVKQKPLDFIERFKNAEFQPIIIPKSHEKRIKKAEELKTNIYCDGALQLLIEIEQPVEIKPNSIIIGECSQKTNPAVKTFRRENPKTQKIIIKTDLTRCHPNFTNQLAGKFKSVVENFNQPVEIYFKYKFDETSKADWLEIKTVHSCQFFDDYFLKYHKNNLENSTNLYHIHSKHVDNSVDHSRQRRPEKFGNSARHTIENNLQFSVTVDTNSQYFKFEVKPTNQWNPTALVALPVKCHLNLHKDLQGQEDSPKCIWHMNQCQNVKKMYAFDVEKGLWKIETDIQSSVLEDGTDFSVDCELKVCPNYVGSFCQIMLKNCL